VQAARESARRSQCSNNLKQMALACHSHHDSHKQYPTAGRQDSGGARTAAPTGQPAHDPLSPAPTQRWNWRYQILPFIEQSQAHEQTSDALVRLTPIRTYFCPSRRPQTIVGGVIVSDYAGNSGTNWCPANRVDTWNGVIIPGLLANLNPQPTYLEPITTAKVLDGTSNSLMLGEKYVSTDQYASVLQWGDNESWGWGNSWGHTRNANQQPRQDSKHGPATIGTPPANAPGNGCGPFGLGATGGYYDYWGSAHPAGFQAGMADGSVRTIRYTISMPTLRAISHRHDGQAVGSSEL
jgi:hypothetical protein